MRSPAFTHRIHPAGPPIAPGRVAPRTFHRVAADERVFAVALLAIELHLIVAATLSGRSRDFAVALAGVALVPAAMFAFDHGGRIVRTLLPGIAGLVAAAPGLAHHAARIATGVTESSDYTGALLGLAGLALIALAFYEALHGRRLAIKLLAIPVALVLLEWYALPVLMAGLATNAGHPDVAGAATLGLRGARDVAFPAGDGTPLKGWYVPGRGDAAVILMHGSHGTRASTLAHLQVLAAAGYGVLAFDARGHGESGGQTNALGWRGSSDVAGAFDFLRRQAGVNPERIAALGLSMGGEEALRAAADGIPLAAVIADGAGASTTGDQQLASPGAVPTSVSWLAMRGVEMFSGDSEPVPLHSVVGHITAPVLLIASNARDERTIDQALRRSIGPNATLWYVPDAGHTKTLLMHPAAYKGWVTTFLADAVRDR
jgi:uncharacterized protein